MADLGPQRPNPLQWPLTPENVDGLDATIEDIYQELRKLRARSGAGVIGEDGSIGPPGMDGAPGDEGAPGPPGVRGLDGAAGVQGAQGPMGPFGLDGEDAPEYILAIPGPQGMPGATGATGPPGVPGPMGMDAEEPLEPWIVPGPPGPTGATGAAGAGGNATTVEVDLGATPTFRGTFTITDGTIDATKKVLVWQAPGPYTGKGTNADEASMQAVSILAVVPAAGSALAYWQTPFAVTPKGDRLGKVEGNVKFSYSVFA
jgi:hypothetical protein